MSKLIVVPTPIGNLKDMTYRAVEVLGNVDLVLAEDTRTTQKLLAHYQINAKLQSFHMNNEHKVLDKFIKALMSGTEIALVSDAGTPGISDPGYMLIREAVRNNIPVECLPGATAMIPAAVASGLPCDRFYFEGFLPHKKGRIKKIDSFKELDQTVILYESPHRIIKLLTQLEERGFGENQIVVGRELSKIYEEYIRGTVNEVLAELSGRPSIKGEIVVVFDPSQKDA